MSGLVFMAGDTVVNKADKFLLSQNFGFKRGKTEHK